MQLNRAGKNTRIAGEHNQTITQAGKQKDRKSNQTQRKNAFQNEAVKQNMAPGAG